jgi:hypothetical protein
MCVQGRLWDPDTHVRQRVNEYIVTAVQEALLGMAAVFMALPVQNTYNAAYYALSEDTEPVYFWFWCMYFGIMVLMVLLLCGNILWWFCVPADERRKTYYQRTMENARRSLLTAQEGQDLADLDALAAMGKSRSSRHKTMPKSKKGSSKGEADTKPKKKKSSSVLFSSTKKKGKEPEGKR